MKLIFYLFLISCFVEFKFCRRNSQLQIADKRLKDVLDSAKIIKSQKIKKHKRKIIGKKRGLKLNLKTKKELEKIGFKKGLEYAKRKLNMDEIMHNSSMPASFGIGSLALGSLSREKRLSTLVEIQKYMKEKFVEKNAVMNIVSQDLQNLHYIIAKMNSSGRHISDIESRITERIQGKIYDLYADKTKQQKESFLKIQNDSG